MVADKYQDYAYNLVKRVIDEIGPLELHRGGGFAPVLPLLRVAKDVLIVVRGELVQDVLSYLGGHRYRCFNLTESNRDRLPTEIVSFFTDPR